MKVKSIWNVVYERHEWDQLYATSRFQTKSRLLATLVYHWYDCFYVMSILPVKSLMMYRSNGKIMVKRGMKCKARGRDQLARLKRRA